MDRERFYSMMGGEGKRDYEIYLNTQRLLTCQKDFDELCNHDELMFQIVHQTHELWMKLIAFTLLEIDEHLGRGEARRAVTLFHRVHRILRQMISSLEILETMSPKEYQQIRAHLGNGSGQESPGFITLGKMPRLLWQTFDARYLTGQGITVAHVYETGYDHGDAYVIAECLVEYDELFQKFRYYHVQLIHRTIGISATSLKGRSVDVLEQSLSRRFFPELWEIRSQMTDGWGKQYGAVRSSLEEAKGEAA